MSKWEILKGPYFIGGVVIAAAYYFLDALMMTYYFHEGDLWHSVADPSPDDLWMRSSMAVILVALGALVQDKMLTQLKTEKDMEALNIELSRERDRANDANQAKSEFLASMSHDLRTPLNAIMGFSDVINNEMFGPIKNSKYAEYISDIHFSGAYLLQLVNDILDISKIEAHERTLNREFIDFGPLAHECLASLESLSEIKKISAQLDIANNLTPIYADQQSIKQLLMNVIGNAIKFTPYDGAIVLSAIQQNNYHIISVKDNGIGIHEEDLQTITDPFTRVENCASKLYEGTGLGLAIVKSLVEMHDGKLEISSDLGKGTTVTMYFPTV